MKRIRVHHYERDGLLWRPHIEVEPGVYRTVQEVAQPTGQEAFVASVEREVLFSGPRGTGKTRSLSHTFLAHVGAGYGNAWRGVLLRRHLTGFTTLEDMLRYVIIPIWGNAATYNQNKHEWRWNSGELLKLGHYDDAADYSTYLGQEWAWIGFEELTDFECDTPYRQMMATNRSPVAPLMIRATCNPGGSGHVWVKRRFDPPTSPQHGYIIGPRITVGNIDRRAICSSLIENQLLLVSDPNYAETVRESAKDHGQMLAWVFGDWNAPGGGLFEECYHDCAESFLLPDIPSELIPPSWTIKSGFDWGESQPAACLWIAISDGSPINLPNRVLRFRKGDVLVFDELYFCEPDRPNTGLRWTASEVQAAIIARENETGLRFQTGDGHWHYRVRTGVADNQIFAQRVGAHDVEVLAEIFERATKYNGHLQRGLRWEAAEKSPGSRALGWQMVRNKIYGTVAPREREGLFITKRCEHTLRTLRELPRDGKKPDDCPTGSEDHLGDVLRYLLTTKHTPPLRTYRRQFA